MRILKAGAEDISGIPDNSGFPTAYVLGRLDEIIRKDLPAVRLVRQVHSLNENPQQQVLLYETPKGHVISVEAVYYGQGEALLVTLTLMGSSDISEQRSGLETVISSNLRELGLMTSVTHNFPDDPYSPFRMPG